MAGRDNDTSSTTSGGFQPSSVQSIFSSATSDAFKVPRNVFSGPPKSFSTKSTANLLPAQSSFESKNVTSGFGELPGSRSLFSSAVPENAGSSSTSSGNIFGGISGTSSFSAHRTDNSSSRSVSGEAPFFQSTAMRQSSNLGAFVTSSSLLFGGSSWTPETKTVTSNMSQSIAPVFSVSSANVTSQSTYSSSGVPNLFGGNTEKSKGFLSETQGNVFGGVSRSSSSSSSSTVCFTSISSSSGPRLFGGIPSIASMTEKSSEKKTSTFPPFSNPLEVAPSENVPSGVLTCSSNSMAASVFPAPSSSVLFANVFGGKSDKSDALTESSTLSKFPITDKVPKSSSSSMAFPAFSEIQKPHITEPSTTSTIFSSESGKLDSTIEKNSTRPTTLFGGTSNNEPGEIAENKQEKKPSCENQDSPFDPGATLVRGTSSQLEPGEIVDDDDQDQENKSSFGNQEVLKGPIDKELKSILSEDLMNILGNDGADQPQAKPPNDPPVCDKKELTKIIIAQIPNSCMDKDIIKNHFKKFGSVTRVYLNSKSNQATVQYADHKGASKAKRKGQKIHPMLPEVKIFYGAPARRRSEESNSDAKQSKRKAIKTLQQSHSATETKVPSDLDPYTPIERPSKLDTPSFLLKPSKKDLQAAGRSFKELKDSHVRDGRPRVFKDLKSRLSSPKVSPRPLIKTETTRTSSPAVSPRPVFKATSKGMSPKGSPIPMLKTATSKITRMESPKPALIKMEEEKLRTSARSISPARDYHTLPETKNLKSTLEMETQNSGDRYSVLKARDKMMRNDRKKRLDINKATKLDAICPDMCPEMERYMRDIQNDLSSYELTNGALDHKLVIKKFSRSSADKEEPLPHELRPGPVLLKTMDFLVCNIIVLCDKKDIDIGIWYNYIWDRTRAVRNDITQQQLTDGIAVTIIERCVRFHIFTDVHLCEESPDVFDRKLNTENLTKSLQTLKELYKDLAELGKYFQSESEFRAYEMLLNLNDGEKIVHQYSQFRDEIQKSPDVIFALKVFLALKSHNFVKFFKLIRSGTYLQGCISHRYFPQVRSKALDIFVKSYVVSKQVTIPLSYMIKTLGFEDKTDATDYLNYHGIAVDNASVIIDKSMVDLHPEGQPPVTRPVKLIDSNRLFSVAEVIQGGPIPENPLNSYVPHDSFDGRGFLKSDAVDASDQLKKFQLLSSGNVQGFPFKAGEHLSIQVSDQPLMNESDLSPPGVSECLSDHDYMIFVKDSYDNVTTDVVSSLSEDIVRDAIDAVSVEEVHNAAAESVTHKVLSQCVKKEIVIVASEAISVVAREVEERKRKEWENLQKKRKAAEELRHSISRSLCDEYISSFIQCMLNELCSNAVHEIQAELQRKAHNSILKELPSKLINEVIREEISNLGKDLITEMIHERERKIEKLLQKIRIRKMRDCFSKWKKVVIKARRQRQAQATFPATFSQLSIQEQNEALPWGYDRKRSENLSAEGLLERELNFKRMSEKLVIINQLKRAVVWYPLPLQQEFENIIDKPSLKDNVFRRYFKVLICTSEGSNSTVLKWIRSKLSGVENAPNEEALHWIFSSQSKFTGREFGSVFHEVSLHSLSADDFRGASAVIFVTGDFTVQDSCQKSIKDFIRAHADLPYRVICEQKSSDNDCWEVNEEDLLNIETSQKLLTLILDLWHAHSERVEIVSSCLNDFISGFVATHYVKSSFLKQQERIEDGKSPISPGAYINLFNAVVQKLVEVVEDEECSKLDWPPHELSHLSQVPSLHWNKDAKEMSSMIKEMKVPALNLKEFMTWKELIQKLKSFVTEISHPGSFCVMLWSNIDSLLHNTQKMLEKVYKVDCENDDVEVHMSLLPWADLIHACISYKMSNFTNVPVYYQPKKLKSFACPDNWWLVCNFSESLSPVKHMINPRKRKVEEEACQNELKKPLLSSELLLDIAREKEKQLEFLEKLERTVEGQNYIFNVSESENEVGDAFMCVTEEVRHEGQVTTYSEFLSEIENEKQKHLEFQKKLENILGEGEDLRFLFKE